jgi:hypothetical protein
MWELNVAKSWIIKALSFPENAAVGMRNMLKKNTSSWAFKYASRQTISPKGLVILSDKICHVI